MYAVVMYSPSKHIILKVCSLVDAEIYLDEYIIQNQNIQTTNNEDYFRENYGWNCRFNHTIKTIARNEFEIYAIVEIKSLL